MAPERGKTPQRLGDLVSEFLRSSGIKRRDERKQLADAWCHAVGPVAARRSSVVSFRDGKLTVRVESAALRQELETFRRGEVLRRMQEAFPGKRVAALKCILK
jgi:predicted nucleic acid-binding Zn ribbon protein